MNQIDWNKVAQMVNSAMIAKGVGSEWVAHKAGVDRRTVDRLRKGAKIRLQNLSAIAGVLETSVLGDSVSEPAATPHTAPPALGGYTLGSCGDYIGDYYMFRRSYDYPDRIICAHLAIFWDDDHACLRFTETQHNRTPEGKQHSYSFTGDVSIPLGLGCAQFIGRFERGFTRIMTCTSLRGDDPAYFKGILVGLNALGDLAYYPVSSPVFIERTQDSFAEDGLSRRVGSYPADQLWHSSAAAELSSIGETFMA